MKLITTLILIIILLFGGMTYGQEMKDSVIHFIPPKIAKNNSTTQEKDMDSGFVPPPQVPLSDSLLVHDYVEQMPQFPGGQDTMMQFLSRKIKYPEQARDANIQGRVFASFVVESNGELSHIEIIRGIGHGCDQEVIRVLKLMPKWKPGKLNGKSVQVRFRLPVNFKFADDEIKPPKYQHIKNGGGK